MPKQQQERMQRPFLVGPDLQPINFQQPNFLGVLDQNGQGGSENQSSAGIQQLASAIINRGDNDAPEGSPNIDLSQVNPNQFPDMTPSQPSNLPDANEAAPPDFNTSSFRMRRPAPFGNSYQHGYAMGGRPPVDRRVRYGENGEEIFIPDNGGNPEVIGENGPETGVASQKGTIVPMPRPLPSAMDQQPSILRSQETPPPQQDGQEQETMAQRALRTAVPYVEPQENPQQSTSEYKTPPQQDQGVDASSEYKMERPAPPIEGDEYDPSKIDPRQMDPKTADVVNVSTGQVSKHPPHMSRPRAAIVGALEGIASGGDNIERGIGAGAAGLATGIFAPNKVAQFEQDKEDNYQRSQRLFTLDLEQKEENLKGDASRRGLTDQQTEYYKNVKQHEGEQKEQERQARAKRDHQRILLAQLKMYQRLDPQKDAAFIKQLEEAGLYVNPETFTGNSKDPKTIGVLQPDRTTVLYYQYDRALGDWVVAKDAAGNPITKSRVSPIDDSGISANVRYSADATRQNQQTTFDRSQGAKHTDDDFKIQQSNRENQAKRSALDKTIKDNEAEAERLEQRATAAEKVEKDKTTKGGSLVEKGRSQAELGTTGPNTGMTAAEMRKRARALRDAAAKARQERDSLVDTPLHNQTQQLQRPQDPNDPLGIRKKIPFIGQ